MSSLTRCRYVCGAYVAALAKSPKPAARVRERLTICCALIFVWDVEWRVAGSVEPASELCLVQVAPGEGHVVLFCSFHGSRYTCESRYVDADVDIHFILRRMGKHSA